MDWIGLIYISAITVCAIFAAKTADKQPYQVDVCLVESGPEGEDVSTYIWSDQLEMYMERYPGSHCGTCERPRSCPKE